MNCNNCKTEYEYFKNFCPNCGYEISFEEKMKHKNNIKIFKKRNIFVIIIIEIITLGFYNVYWLNENINIINNFTFNNKISKKIISWYIFLIIMVDIFLIIACAIFVLSLLKSINLDFKALNDILKALKDINIFKDIIVYVSLVLCFQFKWILENNIKNIYNGYLINISGIMLYFFSIIYLQYKINEILEIDQKN